MSDQSLPRGEGMRREQFSLEVSNVGWFEADGEPAIPTLSIAFDGDASALRRRIEDGAGNVLEASETDVTVRLNGGLDDDGASAVVAVTDRVTGDYVLEFNVAASEILTFTKAARRFAERTDGGARYRIRIVADGELATYEKETLLVYSEDGELLRQHSLIPSGVEI